MVRRPARRKLPGAPNILVIETGLLGEILVVTPALRALRKAYPGARVTVLVSPGSAAMLVGNPAVNRLLPLPKSQRSSFPHLVGLSSWIRGQRFDAALVFHTSFRSALLVAMAGVRIRAGLVSEGRGLLLTRKVPRDRAAYEVDEHLKVLGLLGIAPDGQAMDLPLLPEEREEAARLLPDLPHGSKAVGLHPGASAGFRRWHAERFAELGARLRDTGIEPVFVFGPKEDSLADAVLSWWRTQGLPAPRIVRPRTPRILGALFERMDAVVTNNTGPMHVAAAVGVPGVFIHGPTPVARWHPPGDRWVAVFADGVACRPCDSPACHMDRIRCMDAVSVDQVYDALTRVIERSPGRRTA